MTQSWERVRGIPGREDHLPLRTGAWSSPFPPRVDDPDDERGNNPSSNATPDTQTVKGRGSTKCRNGHGAHESGSKRARNGHGAHESGSESARNGAPPPARDAPLPRRMGLKTGRPVAEDLSGPPLTTDRQCQQSLRLGLAASRARRGSMIATAPRGMPRERQRETPVRGDFVDTEASAPPVGVQGDLADELRLRTAAPPPRRPGSTAPPPVAGPVHSASRAVALPPQEWTTKSSRAPFQRLLAEDSRIVATVAPLGIRSEPKTV